jgi:hypothetical protein
MKSLRIALLVALLLQLSGEASDVYLTRYAESARGAALASNGGPNSHWILQFKDFPQAAQRRELARRGVRVLEDVADSALLASVPESTDLRGLEIIWTGRLTPAARTAPGLEAAAAYLVVFHADVPRRNIRRSLAGFRILKAPNLEPNRVLVAADLTRLPRLAARDQVSYILPGDMASLQKR